MAILFENYSCDENLSGDLNAVFCGRQKCPASHSFGPHVRSHFLIHFILKGKGKYFFDGKTYELGENEGFLIFPGDETVYIADENNPWDYMWVGFDGVLANTILSRCGLNRSNPTFLCDNEGFKREFHALLEEMKNGSGGGFSATGRLYVLLSRLFKRDISESSPSLKIFNSAVSYIKRHYNNEISVDYLAKSLYIDRSHLFRVFKTHAKKSPSEFITDYRMKKAAELLTYSAYNISEIASHCGYDDVSTFCKSFKRVFGIGAKAYRGGERGG